MKQYKAVVFDNRYPTYYNVEATNLATAAGRAIRAWKKRRKGQREPKVFSLRLVQP